MKTIKDYIDMIKKNYIDNDKENVFSIGNLLELEDENTGEIFEIFRVVKLDYVNEEAVVFDFEYSVTEDLVLKWEAEADYSKVTQMDINNEADLMDLVLTADNFLIHDFLVTELSSF